MFRRFVRQYSQSAFGRVETQGSTITVYAAQPIQQYELFAKLKQHDREKAFDKVLSAIIYEKSNAATRSFIFRPSLHSYSGYDTEEEKLPITVGDIKMEIPKTCRKFLGKPSTQDLRVLTLTSRDAEEVMRALNYVKECLTFPRSLGKNFDPVLTEYFLQRAATAGNFEEVFKYIASFKKVFGPFTKEAYHSEALRLYALRVPYLSVRSKSMLNKLYKRSKMGLGRELSYAYGLNAYANKFGEEYKGHLLDTFKNIKKEMEPFMERPRRVLMKSATLTDLVLGYEAVANCTLKEATELVDPLNRFLEVTSHHRELSAARVLQVSENEPDSMSEE